MLLPSDPPPPDVAQLSRAGAVRERYIVPDAAVITQTVEAAAADRARAVHFDLFDGASVDVSTLTFDKRSDGLSWGGTGTAPDGSGEAVSLTVHTPTTAEAASGIAPSVVADFWAGSPVRHYHLGVAAGAVHVISELEEGQLPGDEGDGPFHSDLPTSPAPVASAAAAADDLFVDVMVVYTHQALLARPTLVSNDIPNWINQGNMANGSSGIPFTFRLVHTDEVDYAESGDMRTDLENLERGVVPNLAALRSASAADLVSMVVSNQSYTTICGRGNTPGPYSVINASPTLCGEDLTLAHELGHNFGLHHDWDHDDRPGTTAYNWAHGFINTAGRFRTILAYNDPDACPGSRCVRIPRWSDPNTPFGNEATGTPHDDPHPADNADALRNLWRDVSRFMVPPSVPVGSFEDLAVVPGQGGLEVVGWALDGDTLSPIDVHIYDNGVARGAYSANKARDDVGTHGFHEILPPTTEGSHEICVYAIDSSGYGPNPLIGCITRNVLLHPFGAFEGISRSPAGLELVGWAIDPQAGAAPINVRVEVDGVTAMTDSANRERSDIGSAYPQYGPYHAFHTVLGSPPAGTHEFCVTALNVGGGADQRLRCVTVTVSNDPYGSLEPLIRAPGGVRVRGWAIDPDTADAIPVAFTVDGAPAGGELANQPRSDVAAVYPDYGPNHGYSSVIPLASGIAHTVCAVAVNRAPGTTNTTLGCRAYTAGPDPFGSFEGAWRNSDTAAGVGGWAIEPDAPAPAAVRVTIDGLAPTTPGVANQTRNDVGSTYPEFGPDHGFVFAVTVTPGPHLLCVTVLNTGPGADTNLGCRSV